MKSRGDLAGEPEFIQDPSTIYRVVWPSGAFCFFSFFFFFLPNDDATIEQFNVRQCSL